MPTNANSQLVLHTGALRHNYRAVMAAAAPAAVIPVLKCDGYGLGAAAVARVLLAENAAPPALAVAHTSEAVALRAAGVDAPLLILGAVPPAALADAVGARCALSVFTPEQITQVSRQAEHHGVQRQPVHLKIDTGLGRYGAKPGAQLAAVIAALHTAGNLTLAGAFSHFVDGEVVGSERAKAQLQLFHCALEQLEHAGLEVPLRHICASGASEWFEDSALDAVRIGRRLYLDAPHLPGAAAPTGDIQDAFTWRAWVVHTKHIRAGETLGYGGTFKAEADMDIAVVGVGYGDGLATELAAAGAPVLVNGRRAKLLATCMDACFVDVTALACAAGDEVVFFGTAQDGTQLPAQEVAGLIGHEGVYLTSKLSPRVERVVEA